MKRLVKRTIAHILNGPLMRLIPSRVITQESPETAEDFLCAHSPDPGISSLCRHTWPVPKYDLTIIVPVYNVEPYLETCLDSILSQNTRWRFHVVVVNDGSTDGSAGILEGYSGVEWMTVIHQENGGLSKARNTGLELVKGRYIMFVDSDDSLVENAIESLMSAAERYKADIVQGGYYDVQTASGVHLRSHGYQECTHVEPNGTLAGMAWGKVYRTEMLENVEFPVGYWYEDTIVTGIVTHLAKQIVTIPDMVYCYRQNPSGITGSSKGKPKSIDTYWIHKSVMRDRKKLGLVTDCAFYEHLIRMVALSYQRTEYESQEVKIALMILWKDLLEKERKDDFVLNPKYRNLEKAIMESDYRKYKILCKFCY